MKKIILIIFSIIIVAIIIFGVYFYVVLNKKGGGKEGDFIVTSGQSTKEIGENLQREGFISSAFIFTAYTKLKAELIQVGVYRLTPDLNIKEIIAILSGGQSTEYSVTIPEGWRVTQIDDFLAEKEIISKGELTQIASADEGYLFPDTYKFLPSTKAADIRQQMMDNFSQKTMGKNVTREVLILASIVEREAKVDQDRPKVAGVYLNRLEKGMKLEADPTVQYAKGSWDKITTADYRNTQSSYNTYLNPGLPPGPICNPGLKSIEAVLYPQKDGFFYFFHTSGGETVYSHTSEEHLENLKKYQ